MHNKRPISDWLPTTVKEAQLRSWDEMDVVIFSGDAYVDHPAFGPAAIGRIIESEGFRVAIVPQPNWQDDLRDFKKFGTPKYFFGVTSGCMDSMVNHYTAAKKRRSNDAYTPAGEIKKRPDYATTVYTKILKELYPETPVVVGGIEASLRRVTHYDYWSDKLFPSILVDSGADLLVYGMGEQPLREILSLLKKGVPFHQLTSVKQTSFISHEVPKNKNWKDKFLNAHEACLADKKTFASNFKMVEQESNKTYANRLIQPIDGKAIVINPPYPTADEKEIDKSYSLPFTRLPHPKYNNRGAISAYEMIKFSINMHRGCFGGCSFCTISAHQGKFIASRSQKSILDEVEQVVNMPDFKGYISDLGGPSANMYKMKGKDMSICDRCVAPSCIHPVVCDNLDTNHDQMTMLYEKVDAHPKVKKAFVGSGIRYDLLTPSYNKKGDKESMNRYMEQVLRKHVSGRLKVAPEHTADETLRIMRKPSFKHFKEFKKDFDRIDRKFGLNQKLIPYFISSHPGCKQEDMANLACETKEMGFQLEQVNDFTPTPMTVATVIFYSGYHPYTLEPYYTPKSAEEKKEQNRFFFWYKKENQDWIRKVLGGTQNKELLHRLLGKQPAQAHKAKPIKDGIKKENFKAKHKHYKKKKR